MNAQTNPDTRIDQLLTALRTTEPPAGLEARIAARLAHAAEARSLPPFRRLAASRAVAPSLYSVILNAVKDPRIFLAPARRNSVAIPAALTILTALTALTALTFVHHRTPTTTAQTLPVPDLQFRVPHLRDGSIVAKVGITPGEAAGLQSRYIPSPSNRSLAGPPSSQPSPSAQDPSAEDRFAQDPDQLALAETLAPSRAAPLPPLTSQEKSLVAATRPGQPIQLAELDLARARILRAQADAIRAEAFERYVKNLLAPFAVADALPSSARTSHLSP
jgi:hypothetical protein